MEDGCENLWSHRFAVDYEICRATIAVRTRNRAAPRPPLRSSIQVVFRSSHALSKHHPTPLLLEIPALKIALRYVCWHTVLCEVRAQDSFKH